MSAIVTIQTRSGTAAQWTAVNPILALGEQGIETDTRKVKYGDGVTAWNTLAYATYTLPIATTSILGGVISDGNSINVDGTGVISTVSVGKIKQQVKNATGSILTKGQAVYVNGANGTNVTVALAQANAESTSSKTLGLIEADIAINGFGYVVTEGVLTGLNTNAAANEGDPVWLSPTVAGGLVYGVANKPLAPYHLVYMGVVSRKNANNGEIFIKVQNGYELEELHNVSITTPINWNVLRYDSVTSLWKNDVLPASSGTVTNVSALTLGTTGTDVSSVVANSTTTPVITLNIPTASATNRGALSSADWTTFNNKLSSLPTASTTILGGVKVDGTTITIDGSGVISSYQTYTLPTASTTVLGGVKVDGTSITINGSGVISGASTYTLPTASTTVLGGVKIDGTSITINGSGVISSSGGGGGGTVTTVAVVNANGFNATIANPTTAPNITLSTTVTGIIKGNGTALSAATAGTDYSAGTSALTTGLVKSTTSTGALSIAVAGTDYQSAQSVTGIVKSSGTTRSAATAGTDYSAGTSALATGILKSTTSTGALSIAVAADFPTLNQDTTGTATAANGLKSATTTVSVSGATAPTSGQVLTAVDGTTATWQTPTGGGSGTVTSVAMTVPSFLSITGSPITSSGTLAVTLSGTALPVANGGTGLTALGTGVTTFLGTPTSANLKAAVTDETGSGALVFATSPTLVTPVLGTPSSGTLTSCTGLPIATGVSGLAAGAATFLATPSSANLAALITDETGTGLNVFATSPSLTTPTITGTKEVSVAMAANDINLALGSYFSKTSTGAFTATVSNVPASGTGVSFILDLTNGGAGTITWWAGTKWVGGTAPTLTATGRDVLGFFTYDGGTTWTGLVLGKDVK